MKNLHYAVAIIVALSLLLGLSIGQNYWQHQRIQQLERPMSIHPEVVYFQQAPQVMDGCHQLHMARQQARMEEIEVRLQMAKEQLRHWQHRRRHVIEE